MSWHFLKRAASIALLLAAASALLAYQSTIPASIRAFMVGAPKDALVAFDKGGSNLGVARMPFPQQVDSIKDYVDFLNRRDTPAMFIPPGLRPQETKCESPMPTENPPPVCVICKSGLVLCSNAFTK